MKDDENEGRFDEIEESVSELKESLKQRETSLIRALGTLIKDWNDYRQGDREAFPTDALLGVVWAYLRPRVAIVVASFGALALGGLQIWLLVQQNDLMKNQNQIVKTQAKTEQMAAISSVLGTLLAGDSISNKEAENIAIAQLIVYGNESFDVLIQLVRRMGTVGDLSRQVLISGADAHSPEQSSLAMGELANRLWLDHVGVADFATRSAGDLRDSHQISNDAEQWFNSASALANYWNRSALAHGPALRPAPQYNYSHYVDAFYRELRTVEDWSRFYSHIGNSAPILGDREGAVRSVIDTLDRMYSAWCGVAPRSLKDLLLAGDRIESICML